MPTPPERRHPWLPWAKQAFLPRFQRRKHRPTTIRIPFNLSISHLAILVARPSYRSSRIGRGKLERIPERSGLNGRHNEIRLISVIEGRHAAAWIHVRVNSRPSFPLLCPVSKARLPICKQSLSCTSSPPLLLSPAWTRAIVNRPIDPDL